MGLKTRARVSWLLLAFLVTGCGGGRAADLIAIPTEGAPVHDAPVTGVPTLDTPTVDPSPSGLPAGSPAATATLGQPPPTSEPATKTATAIPATETPTGLPIVTPTPVTAEVSLPESPAPFPGAVSAISEPLLVDGERGRIYASAQVDAKPATAVFSTVDGRLLAAFDLSGRLALDRTANRLIVDRGAAGLAILDARTGARLAEVSLPPGSGERPPTPQVNPATGLVYAFRDEQMAVVDPAAGAVSKTTTFDVPGSVCGEPLEALPVSHSEYDLVNDILYLTFVTYRCTPWAGVTIIAYDPETAAEQGRYGTDVFYQAVPFQGSLFGTTASRLGPVTSWAWNGGGTWFEEKLAQHAAPAGIVADWGRGLVYEAAGETIRILDPATHAVLAEASWPLSAGAGRLVGHDPISDNLYFLTGAGRLSLWPAANLFDDGEPPRPVASALPETPVRVLALAAGWPADGTMVGLWDNGQRLDGRCPVEGGRLFMRRQVGADWEQVPVSGNGMCDALADVALSPAYGADQTLFVADNGQAAIFKSIDGGRSWRPAGGEFPSGTQFRRLFISPGFGRDQTLLTHTAAGEVYRSRDGGGSWRRLAPLFDQVAMSPEFDRDGTLMGAAGGDLFLSRDGGETWAEVGPTPNGQQLGLLSLAPLFAKWQVAFAMTTSGELYRSLDGGRSWAYRLAAGPGSGGQLVYAPDNEEERPIFLLYLGNLLASFDGWKTTWSWAPKPSLQPGSASSLAISPNYAADGLLFAGTADGQVIALDAGRPDSD